MYIAIHAAKAVCRLYSLIVVYLLLHVSHPSSLFSALFRQFSLLCTLQTVLSSLHSSDSSLFSALFRQFSLLCTLCSSLLYFLAIVSPMRSLFCSFFFNSLCFVIFIALFIAHFLALFLDLACKMPLCFFTHPLTHLHTV